MDRPVRRSASSSRSPSLQRQGTCTLTGRRQSGAVTPPSIETQWPREDLLRNVASLSAALSASRSVLLRWSAEGEVSVEVNAAISEATRILEASNICPATKKALHLCKALISLVFLAPRPGLEPGTYGLTVPPTNRPESRANAGFAHFGCLIIFTVSPPDCPGSTCFGGEVLDSARRSSRM
jgi:hypothetical protein